MGQNWVCKRIREALNKLTLAKPLIPQLLSRSVRQLIDFAGLLSPASHGESPGLPALAEPLQPGWHVTRDAILIKQIP
jgi:hypothetical protein